MVSFASAESHPAPLPGSQDGRGGAEGACVRRALTSRPALLPRLRVFPSSPGHLFHAHDEKQSLGRVYGYLPPQRQSWFTISGDKVRLPLPPRRLGTGESSRSCTVPTDGISQTMGKLGTSLSSGHVLVNGTRKQVLLAGAPTHGRSHAGKHDCVFSRVAS